MFVRLNAADPDATGDVAVTLYDPAVALARKPGAVAIPEAFVIADAVIHGELQFEMFWKLPPAPMSGAEKVTITPETGFVFASLTMAVNNVGNTEFPAAD